MTITELRDELNKVIAYHVAQGWEERNNQEVIVTYPVSKRINEYRKLKMVHTGSYGLGSDTPCKTEWFTRIEAQPLPYKRF